LKINESDPYVDIRKNIPKSDDTYEPVIRSLWSTKIWKAVPGAMSRIVRQLRQGIVPCTRPLRVKVLSSGITKHHIRKRVYEPIIRTFLSTKIRTLSPGAGGYITYPFKQSVPLFRASAPVEIKYLSSTVKKNYHNSFGHEPVTRPIGFSNIWKVVIKTAGSMKSHLKQSFISLIFSAHTGLTNRCEYLFFNQFKHDVYGPIIRSLWSVKIWQAVPGAVDGKSPNASHPANACTVNRRFRFQSLLSGTGSTLYSSRYPSSSDRILNSSGRRFFIRHSANPSGQSVFHNTIRSYSGSCRSVQINRLSSATGSGTPCLQAVPSDMGLGFVRHYTRMSFVNTIK